MIFLLENNYTISDDHYESDPPPNTREVTYHVLDIEVSGKINNLQVNKSLRINTSFQRGFPFRTFRVKKNDTFELLQVNSAIYIGLGKHDHEKEE